MEFYWMSPRYFSRAGVFLRIGQYRFRVIPVPKF